MYLGKAIGVRIEQVDFKEAKPLRGGSIYYGADWFTEPSGEWNTHDFKTRGSCFLNVMFREISIVGAKGDDDLVRGT